MLGVLVILIYGLQFHGGQYASVISIGLLAAGACLVVGGLLGFLFGIPHTLQGSGSQAPTSGNGSEERKETGDRTSYRANTNLEQISDWLTKILVGLGLTQIGAISDSLQSLVSNLSKGLGNADTSLTFAAALLVFYVTSGFLLGFLWTRLNLASAMREADVEALGERLERVEAKAERVEEKADKIKEQADRDARALSLVERTLNPDSGAPSPTVEELTDALKGASDSIKIQIFQRARAARRENWRKDKERMERSIPVFRALIADDGQERYHRNFAQLGYALKDQRHPDLREAEQMLTKAIEIRNRSPEHGWYRFYEFNRAGCRIAAAGQNGFSSERRQEILDDLEEAARNAALRALILGDPQIKAWMTTQRVGFRNGQIRAMASRSARKAGPSRSTRSASPARKKVATTGAPRAGSSP
jgi:hypothetical protein